jgi:hypothetical protein
MTSELFDLLRTLIDSYQAATGQMPACVKMHPETMAMYEGDQILTCVANVPVIRNEHYAPGGIFALDATNLDQPGDL